MKQLIEYGPFLGLAVQAVALWFMWSMRQLSTAAIAAAEAKSKSRDEDLDNRIDHEATRITELVGRVTAAESDIRNLPTKEDLARVEGEVKVGNSKIDTANAGIDRLEGYLLQRGLERA